MIADDAVRTPTPFALRDLAALTKPRLSSLVLITCGGAMALAPGHFGLVRAALTLLATAGVVGSANALNSYLERDLDRRMQRTSLRPLPAGRLDPRLALFAALCLGAVSLPLLWLSANPLTALLGLVAHMSYVAVYTPMKQRSPLAMWVGAVPGALPPLMGWTAVTNRLDVAGALLFSVLFCWQIPHFLAIAVFRRDEYARAGHKVLPLVASERAVKLHSLAWTLLLLVSSVALQPAGVTKRWYAPVALALGLWFLVPVVRAFAAPAGDEAWARKVFRASLVYLTALFVALGFGAA